MTRLFVVRQGETDYNKARRYQGSTDVQLNDTGRSQAVALVDVLAHLDVDVIVSSPLQRARQTAEPLSRARDLPVHAMAAFAERNLSPSKEPCSKDVPAKRLRRSIRICGRAR